MVGTESRNPNRVGAPLECAPSSREKEESPGATSYDRSLEGDLPKIAHVIPIFHLLFLGPTIGAPY